MKRTKRWLAGLLCAVLLAGLLPTAASAATADWAAPAVTALQTVYPGASFSADDGQMTVGDLNTILGQIGATTKVTLGTDGTDTNATLTRGTACAVLADIFDLPANGSAIQYLYNQHIINGKDASGSLGQSDPITKAEFAVITYRVLNSVGGGMGSGTVLKPGTKEYIAWVSLFARGCLNYEENNARKEDTPTEAMDQSTLTRWKNKLNSSDTSVTVEDGDTKLAAAVKVVEACGITQIFTDVNPGDWYYDGIMYLFDHGVLSGYGDGTFLPTNILERNQFAILLARADTSTVNTDEITLKLPSGDKYQWLQGLEDLLKSAVAKGYMSPDENDSEWWVGHVTREEAIVGIMKMCERKYQCQRRSQTF